MQSDTFKLKCIVVNNTKYAVWHNTILSTYHTIPLFFHWYSESSPTCFGLL